ncbi:hypothetical protein AEAC466_04575 [Asticcacaulis sp. AC466]|nr:hypothetical protein AEAC466_04575 [Asticcacaulis sp. AC466]
MIRHGGPVALFGPRRHINLFKRVYDVRFTHGRADASAAWDKSIGKVAIAHMSAELLQE